MFCVIVMPSQLTMNLTNATVLCCGEACCLPCADAADLPCSDVTWIIRNNELGGQIAPGYSPLASSSADLENFAPTGAEGVPNAPLFIPYQVLLGSCCAFHVTWLM